MDKIEKINLKALSSTGFELEFEDERKSKIAFLNLQVQLNDCRMIRQEITGDFISDSIKLENEVLKNCSPKI